MGKTEFDQNGGFVEDMEIWNFLQLQDRIIQKVLPKNFIYKKNNRVWVRLYSKFLKKPIMRNYASAVGTPDPKFSASNFNPL